MNEPKVADALAEAVVAEVQSGMMVGLGTGRTASRAIIALAERVKEEGLDIKCVPTSHVTETLARQLRLNVVDFAMVERVGALARLADLVSFPRVLFGSNYPLYYFESALLKLQESGLTEAQSRAVCEGNARHLLAR